MPRTVVLIDPFAKAVDNVTIEEGRPFLDQLRDIIAAPQLDTVPAGPRLMLWVDNLGLLKGDKQRFWRFRDSALRVGGRAILSSIDADGMPMPLHVNPDHVTPGIEWMTETRAIKVHENLVVEQHPQFGNIPRIVREVVWGGPEPVIEEVELPQHEPVIEPPRERVYWIVYNDDQKDDFWARQRKMTAEGEDGFTGEEKRFETFDEVRAFAKEAELFLELPSAADDPSIAATLV